MAAVTYISLAVCLIAAYVLVPYSPPVSQTQSSPSFTSTAAVKPPVDTVKLLMDLKRFNIMASLLRATRVENYLKISEMEAGVTLFAASDAAFANMSDAHTRVHQSLHAQWKASVIKYHILPAYYTRHVLRAINNPSESTLETQAMGAGRYTVNLSKIKGSVFIDTGVTKARVIKTLHDQTSIAIYEISAVLLPSELFGDASS